MTASILLWILDSGQQDAKQKSVFAPYSILRNTLPSAMVDKDKTRQKPFTADTA